jgi:hypothetical protein
MLPGEGVPDSIRRGLGLAARQVGTWFDLYRPRDAGDPLAPRNRVMRLPAAFVAPRGAEASVRFGSAEWHGVFDAGYTRPGDYLAGVDGVFFVASQPRLGPVLCIRTNCVLTFTRPAVPFAAGLNRYGGIQAQQMQMLLTAWPASALTKLREGGRGALPADAPGVAGNAGGWEVLMPALAGVVLRPGDLVHDDLERTGVVGSAELTALGWRLSVRQATS